MFALKDSHETCSGTPPALSVLGLADPRRFGKQEHVLTDFESIPVSTSDLTRS